MKVALLSDCYPPRTGGIESQVSDLAAQLQAAGHRVEVFTATSGAKGERAGATEVLGGVLVHRVSLRLPGGLPVNPLASSLVRERLRVGAFDVAHVHLGVVSPFAWDMVQVTTGLGLPTALTFHCVLDRAAPLLGPALRSWVRRGAVLSAVSSFAAKGVRRGVPGDLVTVLPNGIAVQDWPASTAESHGPLRVVTAARLAPRKRMMALVRIIEQASHRLGPGALSVAVYGGGPLRSLLESRTQARGLSEVLTWQGRVSRERLARAYREADVYLSPARLEAFGIAALEARTSGLPVIARADSGVGEVITHGVSGLLAQDDAGLAAALVELRADPMLRARLTRHNASTTPRQTWDRVVDLALAEYRRAGA